MSAPRSDQEPYGAIVDLDGTVYAGDRLLPGAVEGVAFLRSKGIPHVFLTNNGSRTRTEVSEFLGNLGLHVDPAQIVTSSVLLAEYLIENAPTLPVVPLGGARGLVGTLRELGFEVANLNELDVDACLAIGWNSSLEFDTLAKLLAAEPRIKRIVATDSDRTYPGQQGEPLPGTGWVVGAIGALMHRDVYVCGKPNPIAFARAAFHVGHPIERLVVIGDSLDSDIKPALESRAAAIFVKCHQGRGEDRRVTDSHGFQRRPDLISAVELAFESGRCAW